MFKAEPIIKNVKVILLGAFLILFFGVLVLLVKNLSNIRENNKNQALNFSLNLADLVSFFNKKFDCSNCFKDDFIVNYSTIYEDPLYELVDLNNNGIKSALVTIYGNNRNLRDFYVLTKDPSITEQHDGEIKIIYQRSGAGFSPTRVSWHDAQGNFLLHSTYATNDHRPIFTVILSWNKERKIFEEKMEQ